MCESREKVERYETEVAELKNKCEDLQYDIEVTREKVHTLDYRLKQAEDDLSKPLQVRLSTLPLLSAFVVI